MWFLDSVFCFFYKNTEFFPFGAFTKTAIVFTFCAILSFFTKISLRMQTIFRYSADFLAMNSPELSDFCLHLLCLGGEGSFEFNGRCCRKPLSAKPVAQQQLQHRREHLAHPDLGNDEFLIPVLLQPLLHPAAGTVSE